MMTYLGVQSGQPSDRIWRLRRLSDQDVSTFSWVSAGSRLPNGARYSSSAVVVGCILYVIGGNTESGSPCCDLYSYNMKSGLWTTLTPMTHARAGFCAVAVVESSSILVCGGFGKDKGVLDSAEMYNIGTDSWSMLPSMRFQRSRASGVLYDDRVVVVGGWCNGRALRSVECFDVQRGVWDEMPQLAFGRHGMGVQHVPWKEKTGTLYAVGGWNSDGRIMTTVEVFEKRVGHWARKPDLALPHGRGWMGVA